MPRPPRPWFRFYSEALESRKVQKLGRERPELFVHWMNLLCLSNVTTPRGTLPSVPDIAFALRLDEGEMANIIAELKEVGLVDHKRGQLAMHDWNEWQPDSDAQQTKGRKTRHVGTSKERDRNDVGTSLERETPVVGTHREEKSREEKETEEEADAEEEGPAHPFAFMFTRKHQERHSMNPPSMADQAAALALEREFGADACIEIATDYDWQKHPNYYRPILKERRAKANEPESTAPPAPSYGRGMATVGLSSSESAFLERVGFGRREEVGYE